MEKSIRIEVAYATLSKQTILEIEAPVGVTVRTAIERSRIQDEFPEIDLAKNKVGVYGKLRDLGDTVEDGDRIEIYRPLLIDPKEARRRRSG